MDEKIIRFVINPLIYICVIIAFLIGLHDCIKWYTYPLQLNNPNYLGMAFNTSVAILLASIGILFTKQRINILSMIIGLVVFLFGVLTASEYLLGINFDIDKILIQFRLPHDSPLHIKMSPNAAIAFALIGLTLTFWKYSKSNMFAKMATLVSAATTWSIGSLALIGYIVNIHALYTWGTLNFMAVNSALSLVLLSTALFGLFYVSYPKFIKRKEVKTSSVCFIVLFTLFVLFWQTFDQFVLIPRIAVIVWFGIIVLLTTILYFWELVKKDNEFLEDDIEKRKAIEDSLREKITELNLIYRATSEVAHADDLEEALQHCIDLICDMADWPVGHAYLLNKEETRLIPSNIWHVKYKEESQKFKEITQKTEFSIGIGLPGCIWQLKKPVWIEDIYQDDSSPRAKAYAALNIHGGVGFPIIMHDKIVAILEFFSHKPEKLNPELIRIFQLLSIQVSYILERKSMREKLDQLAHYDSVTSLPNRYYFQEMFARAIAKAERHKELFAILFLDLDHFKNINDSMGHTLGDSLLKEVGQLLRKNIRENDFIARIGGDEFIILMESITNTEEVEVLAERILKTFRTPVQINYADFIISLSIGIAIYPFAGENTQKLLQNADTAMYQAKEKGRNTYQIYNQQLHERSQRINFIDNALHNVIENNELHLVYQPIFNLTTNKIVSAEALLRWQNPKLGDISPVEFIPVAESNGAILKIGEWVFKQACQQLSKWQTQFQNLHLEISINCSTLQLEQCQHFVTCMKDTIEQLQLPPNKIVLELTETGLIKQIKHATVLLHELRKYGFSIAIDDFGAGYSSLNYLKIIPISVLKIDKSFIADLDQNKTTQEIIKAIIQLAKTLDLAVVAEGVETKHQLDILIEFGCQFAQGFYLAKPMLPDDCTEFMADHL